MYFEGWKPAATPIKVKTTEEFLELVALHFNNAALSQSDDLERIVRTIFRLMAHHISSGEIESIKQNLPSPIANLWLPAEYIEKQEAIRKEIKQSTRRR